MQGSQEKLEFFVQHKHSIECDVEEPDEKVSLDEDSE
jgi:hypothetical protein